MRPVREAENLPQSCAVVTKSWNLNFLEPSGPVQACNGTALPFYFLTLNKVLPKVAGLVRSCALPGLDSVGGR
jgi:hypothetical protein